MILVITQEGDLSADNFIEWCHYLGKAVVRINENESTNLVEHITFDNDCNILLTIKGQTFNLAQIESVWFRRGTLQHISKAEYLGFDNLEDTNSITEYFQNEGKTISEFIIHVLKQKRSLNHPGSYNSNKLITLKTAQEVGLNIPKTIIVQHLADVKRHFEDKPVLTKSIQDAITVQYEDHSFSPYLSIGKVDELPIPVHFYYSKFQTLIEAKYELRIFFVADEYYACAHFTTARNKKANPDRLGVSREVPYTLPGDVIEKLKKLNAALGFNSGSIDMLVDESGAYYFLEINPVGQYDAMSGFCNYYLDLKILNFLTNEAPV